MHLAVADAYRAKWTDAIHEEWIRSVLSHRSDLKREQLERTRALMNAHVRDCLVTGYEPLVPAVTLPDASDRHVLAAAIRCGADLIVTFNLRDFPPDELAPFGIEAQHPDEFLLGQLDRAPRLVCAAAQRHRASLRTPPKSVEEYLAALAAQGLAQTAMRLRQLADCL